MITIWAAYISFNPTLVRLRRGCPPVSCPCSPEFQSHAGSIEATNANANANVGLEFQSHAGSIEA